MNFNSGGRKKKLSQDFMSIQDNIVPITRTKKRVSRKKKASLDASPLSIREKINEQLLAKKKIKNYIKDCSNSNSILILILELNQIIMFH